MVTLSQLVSHHTGDRGLPKILNATTTNDTDDSAEETNIRVNVDDEIAET